MKTMILILTLMSISLVGCSSGESDSKAGSASSAQSSKEIYTCPMHPSVISDRPGACPVCGMALVRKSTVQEMSDEAKANLQAVSLSPTQRVMANVTTEPVARRSFRKTTSSVGVVDYAEPMQATVSARFRGRIEKLHVSFTGQQVEKGEPLLDLYSPDLASTKQEFVTSLEALQRTTTTGDEINRSVQERLVQATRNRLKTHFGMTETQIAELEKTKEFSSTMRFHSPIRGTVVLKQVQEGQYVDEGMVLYQLVDLSKVWVYVDVYEKDIRFARVGQPIEVMSEAYPNRVFSGTVTFIDPVINNETRTVRVRAEFDNPQGALKPKMFVRAELITPVNNVLVIPASAVLATGRRTVVWVETQPNTFEPRDVKLGASSDSFYEVVSGLKQGELVAVTGGFLLDSESALQQPSSGDAHVGHSASDRKSSDAASTVEDGSVNILVKGRYIPDVVRVKQGKKVTFNFYRDEDSDCTNEVIFEEFNIRRKLPARKTTSIELTPASKGEFHFTCGMGMVHGRLLVE